MLSGSSMTISHLCLIFGCTPSRCSDIINNQLLSLSRRLKNHPKARIQWPSTLREKEYLADLVHRREPNVLDVIGFTDGLSLPIQCASDPISQATNYNGYHHDTMINNVFCFSPTGKIIFACINFPGSWHDSQVSLSLISKVVRNLKFALIKCSHVQVIFSTNLWVHYLVVLEAIYPWRREELHFEDTIHTCPYVRVVSGECVLFKEPL